LNALEGASGRKRCESGEASNIGSDALLVTIRITDYGDTLPNPQLKPSRSALGSDQGTPIGDRVRPRPLPTLALALAFRAPPTAISPPGLPMAPAAANARQQAR
jgi:hypothetical protein